MSFPAYPDYKDSGVEWLGEVPSHWRLPKIKHVATFAGGSTPSRDDPSFWNGDIPWVSPKDMKSETITGSEERITERGLSQMAGGLIEPGAVLLVVRSGILRHTVPVAITNIPVALNQDMKALRFNSAECAPSFFFRWVQGLNDSLTLAWMKQGATVESLEHQFLAETILPLPPVAEQISISIFLDRETAKIDALIEEQRRLMALLKEERQAVISHAVTRGLDPHAPIKDSGIAWLGEVPEHWTVQPVKAVIEGIEQGWSPQCEAEPVESLEQWGVLKVGCVNGGLFNPDENKALPTDLEPRPELAVRAGDLLISRANTRELVGSVAVVEKDYNRLLLCDKLYRLSVISAQITPEYLASYLRSDVARGQIEVAASGASSSMLNIGQSVVREMPIATPPHPEQQEIVDHLQRHRAMSDALVSEAQSAITLLIERRAALISAAVTGKIDVRESATVIPFPMDRARARHLVATEIIERLAHQPTFGRTKLQKIAYLAEAHANIFELGGCYIRMPFGPLDQAMMDEIEATSSDDRFVTDDKLDGSMVRYRVTGKKGSHTSDLRKRLGEDRFIKLDHLIQSLSDLKTHSAEAIATLYAVWNDALLEGETLNDEQIISAFFRWHPKKRENFRADELPHWLDWMRRHGIVPTGVGPKTMSQTGPLL